MVYVLYLIHHLTNRKDYPKWYSVDNNYRGISKSRSLRSRGGNIALLTWCVLGSVLIYGFQCMLRASFVARVPSPQIEDAEQLYR